jgi:hypothetical protein
MQRWSLHMFHAETVLRLRCWNFNPLLLYGNRFNRSDGFNNDNANVFASVADFVSSVINKLVDVNNNNSNNYNSGCGQKF